MAGVRLRLRTRWFIEVAINRIGRAWQRLTPGGRFFTVTGQGLGGELTCLADAVEGRLRPLHAAGAATFAGNTFIDRETYHDQLHAACPSDPELLRAWVEGDWTVARGAYFASVIDESRNAVAPWSAVPATEWGGRWETTLPTISALARPLPPIWWACRQGRKGLTGGSIRVTVWCC